MRVQALIADTSQTSLAPPQTTSSQFRLGRVRVLSRGSTTFRRSSLALLAHGNNFVLAMAELYGRLHQSTTARELEPCRHV